MEKLLKVQVLINFYMLGLSEFRQRYTTLKRWLQYQKVLQGIISKCTVEGLKLGRISNQQDDLKCRFFITAHFGLYPMILSYLGASFPKQDIVCLVGKQRSIQGLKQLAVKSGVSVKFIEVGDSFMFFRKCLRENRNNSVFISFIDIPLGVSSKNDSFLSFMGGQLRVRSGLFKLAEKLNLTPRFMLSGFDPANSTVDITSYPVFNVEQTFAHFEQSLKSKPFLWDKVIDLHKFYEKELPENIYLPFSIKNDFYAMNAKSRKVLQINKPLFNNISLIKREDRLGNNTAMYKDLIHAKTNICVEQAL